MPKVRKPIKPVKDAPMIAVYIRLTPAELAEYKRLAEADDRTLSAYLRKRLKDAA